MTVAKVATIGKIFNIKKLTLPYSLTQYNSNKKDTELKSKLAEKKDWPDLPPSDDEGKQEEGENDYQNSSGKGSDDYQNSSNSGSNQNSDDDNDDNKNDSDKSGDKSDDD